MQKTKGISLIVLAITIIVMIILAGAIILTLNNSGIIDKASDAVQKSDKATIKEIAQMAWGAAYAEYGADQEMLEQGVKTALTANNLNAEDYGMVVTTSGVEITKGWLQNGLTVVKGTQKLEIGDTVAYVATGTDYEGAWKVLGAENGELLIVSADDVATNYILGDYNRVGDLALATDAHINGVSKLNTLCAAYGKGTGATGARCIKVEDVNKVTGYNPETAGYRKGQIDEYGNEITYMWTGNEDPYYSATNGTKGDIDEGQHNGSFTYFNDEKFVTSTNTGASEENPIEITKLKSTYYYYYPTTLTITSAGDVKGIAMDSKAYIMLFRNSANTSNDNYWLASSCVLTRPDFAAFGLRYVGSGYVRGGNFMRSSGELYGGSLGIRTVVSLSSDIQFAGSSASGWTF